MQIERSLRSAAGSIATRLPLLMVYVINFGVPPLLFAQVLYGRAIYTSSILIGAAWISVIGLLMVVYSLLYVTAARAQRGQTWWWVSLIALGVAGLIALIYSSNMTLMIRPQAWLEMYRSNPLGLRLNLGDPTVWPRWLFMVTGGVCTCGAGLLWLGVVSTLTDDTRGFLRDWGARLMAGGIAVQMLIAGWVIIAQPASVRTALIAPCVVRGVPGAVAGSGRRGAGAGPSRVSRGGRRRLAMGQPAERLGVREDCDHDRHPGRDSRSHAPGTRSERVGPACRIELAGHQSLFSCCSCVDWQ